MQEHDYVPSDPVDAVLSGNGQALSATDALRDMVLAQTIGAIRRRRRLKRGALAAGLLGCYLAGIVTMGFWRHEESNLSGATSRAHMAGFPRQPPSPPAPLPHAGEGSRRTAPWRQGAPRPTHTVADATRNCGNGKTVARIPTAFESWRNIGDHYLRETGDIALAVAGYSQAIDLATEEERAIAPERDNWLMMALKQAREKEKKHGYSETN